ncbi:RNA polymerase sigma factor [Saccharothrix yanglingensis]|uniref:RNA polymerase subunit sigma-70 n=1 Tax=Saccharothrix yanglingensis TaxID=659496 RepID=A0ABU0WVB6_9PSEU|nr:RNA polymerase subunit sigma-70 [Saccharothrix yanglingensis]
MTADATDPPHPPPDHPPPQPDDVELWRRGDRASFGVLFERHVEAVWNHAYRLTGSWEQAQDVTSATFLTAWRTRAQVELVRESARPLLFTMAGNVARTAHRGSARRTRLLRRVSAPVDEPDHADAVAHRVDEQDRLRRVVAAVRRLPRAQRKAAELCLLGGLPVADAAAQLGLAEVSVRAHLSRARARLRDLAPPLGAPPPGPDMTEDQP